MLVKVRRILRSERGEANYMSTVVYIFVAVLLIAFILNVFSIISAKQELDHAADQMVKQIQLSGSVNSDTEELFSYLAGEIGGVQNLTYTVDTNYKSGSRIQLGTPFYITLTGDAKLGGFWNLNLIRISVSARGAGVSERYWK